MKCHSERSEESPVVTRGFFAALRMTFSVTSPSLGGNWLEDSRQAVFSFGSFLAIYFSNGSLFAASTTQGDLFQEEYRYRADEHNQHAHNEDIVDASRQANLHRLDHLVEDRQPGRTLLRGSSLQLRLCTGLQQDLRVAEDAQELRHLWTCHGRLLDGSGQRALEGGQVG